MSLKETADEIARAVEAWPEWKKSTLIARPAGRAGAGGRGGGRRGDEDKEVVVSEIFDMGKGREIDPAVVSGRMCPFRSQSYPVPVGPGKVSFVECLVPCRRDCALWDANTEGCALRGFVKASLL